MYGERGAGKADTPFSRAQQHSFVCAVFDSAAWSGTLTQDVILQIDPRRRCELLAPCWPHTDVIKGKREALLKMIERKLSSGGLSERERKTLINAGHSPDELIAAVREAKQGGGKRSKGKKGKGGGGGGKEGATGATPLRKTILGRLGGGSGDGGSSKQNKSGEAVFGRLGGGGGGKGAGSLRAVLSGVTKAGKVKAVPMAVSAKIVSLKKEQKPKAKKDEGLSVKQRLGMALSDISKRR